ncbi:MAG TPA: septum formation initiator family protein [Dehalococcoidia bacterium]|jgi:cell division protein FtsL|nr:septum formation initiator family protein [Dehalococcoidia bacterium]
MAILHRPALPAPRLFGKPIPRRAVVVAALCACVTVAAMQVNQLSRAASTGYQIDALTQERAEKQAANHDLEAQVAQLSSLARVEWVAKTQLGLVPARHTVYLTVHQQVPDRQSLPLQFQQPAVTAEAPAPAAAEPLWKRLLHRLPFF